MVKPMGFSRRGLLVVLSSPSGAGKTSMTRRLLQDDPSFTLSVSVTTRLPRPGETNGVDYWFINPKQFTTLQAKGELLESAKVFDHYYGTPRQAVEEALEDGKDVLFDIDWQGAQQLSEKAADDLVKIFILPPSVGALQARLFNRSQDSAVVVARRMAKASDEMSHFSEYDWVLINDDFETTLREAKMIIGAERMRRRRLSGLNEFVTQLRRDAEQRTENDPL